MEKLNDGLRHHSATDVLRAAIDNVPNLALVSSFGAESVALLHLASMVKRDLPVLFIDTEMLFAETLVYQQELSERLGLRNVQTIRAQDVAEKDPDGTLHLRDPDACCAFRKTVPLQHALEDSTVGSRGASGSSPAPAPACRSSRSKPPPTRLRGSR